MALRLTCAQSNPDLITPDELRALIDLALERYWTDLELHCLAAHCRSFEELQILSKVYATVLKGNGGRPGAI
jgi:hypothetical protein